MWNEHATGDSQSPASHSGQVTVTIIVIMIIATIPRRKSQTAMETLLRGCSSPLPRLKAEPESISNQPSQFNQVDREREREREREKCVNI